MEEHLQMNPDNPTGLNALAAAIRDDFVNTKSLGDNALLPKRDVTVNEPSNALVPNLLGRKRIMNTLLA
jgi:hypothetical protein